MHSNLMNKRILFLEGLPNVQKLGKVRIGQNVKEILESDLAIEKEAVPALKNHVKTSDDLKDYVSRDLFASILESEEGHIDWLETQLGLLEKVGEQNYIQAQMDPNKAD